MSIKRALGVVLCLAGFVSSAFAAGKTRIYILSSYHREYLWDQDVNEGTVKALLELGYLDNQAQGDEFTKKDAVESSKAIIKKAWMNTKKENKPDQMNANRDKLVKEIDAFKPDILLISDDNGTKYVGAHYKDSKLPVVFCGLDETPLKYGLVDSMDKPGHNVAGVYQRGYYKEAAEALKKLFPDIKTFGVLGDDSESSLAKFQGIKDLIDKGQMPLQFVDFVHTNSFKEWKVKAQDLAKRVDAILVVNHNTLKDDSGQPIDQMQAGSWYLQNIKKPDFSSEKQFVQEGVLLVAEDSGFKQGYEMVRMAARVLRRGEKPAGIPTVRPSQGPIILNATRAHMLGLDPSGHAFVEKTIDNSLALDKFPKT